ncbi:MAG: putative phage-associated protein [Candidatus Wolfebacteria bacterium GW2011_GWB1_47_1]|uniref:Putative phage-associated protein n=1 Tax=Candidatus Wolfebacteria bacterium GW2011_GWB1_47_1 TaxID=1619007 RepID=A0A0G4ARK7_9BACT|nr:MAG: putative phage-associated protein [Candidatus Wolfebacteria bacterium GW2011_GWB1_47_1]
MQKSKSLVIAEYFISKSQIAGEEITNKKIQKLLYYAQAWSLVFNGEKIFDDQIEAWVHGPAIPLIYFEFKKFGFGNISITVNKSDFEALSDKEEKLLDNVWSAYGKFDADYLELLTHNEEPWQKARSGCAIDEYCNNEINTDLMKEYYGRRLEEIKKGQ